MEPHDIGHGSTATPPFRGVALIMTCASMAFMTGCTSPPPFKNIFITTEERGLSARTMSGILLAQRTLKQNDHNAALAFSLAHLYLQAIRENADTAFYGRIETLLEHATRLDPSNPDIPFLRGTIAAGKHDFHRCLPLARRVATAYPNTPRYAGLLVDCLVETGQYDEALDALQRMSDIRPDYAALTRVAYLREIYGDIAGAREAMEQALEAQTGIAENTAWTLAEYGRLLLPSDPKKAKVLYEKALVEYPDFAPAQAGMARVAMAEGESSSAQQWAKQALASMPLPEYAALLGDIERARGDETGAEAAFALVEIGYDAIAARGTNVELERTKFLAEHGFRGKETIRKARAIMIDRPTIFAADLLAWSLYGEQQYEEALIWIQKALATGSKDPTILFHAGMIKRAVGERASAKIHLETLLKESPHFSFIHVQTAKKALESLR